VSKYILGDINFPTPCICPEVAGLPIERARISFLASALNSPFLAFSSSAS